jgi:ABC-type sugar transport system substrate-binding protein
MSRGIDPRDLGDAIAEQLGLYGEEVVEVVNAAGEKAAKELVKLTKATAPEKDGDFKKAITYTAKENPATGDKAFTWGAKAPEHRKTHLLVHGHATVNGGRVPGDPFLEKALDTVLPEYEKDVEEALK